MKRFPKSATFLVWLCGTFLSFVAGVAATIAVGKVTNSGPLGICGPYGPAADLMVWMVLGSIPASIAVGTYAAWRSHRYLTRDEQKS